MDCRSKKRIGNEGFAVEGTAVVSVTRLTKIDVGGLSSRVLPAFSFALYMERGELELELPFRYIYCVSDNSAIVGHNVRLVIGNIFMV